MINLKNALKIALKHAWPIGTEKVSLFSSIGRVLAENIYSDSDLPPFDRSAMDGFAVNSKDPSKTFKIIEDIPAGKVPEKKIRFGQCAKIMTGAMLPKGADKVVKVEDTRYLPGRPACRTGRQAGKKQETNNIQITKHEKKPNVSLRGEDIKKGLKVLSKGKEIRPQEAAMLAAVGKTNIKVYRQPRVAVISTGSELVEPFERPGLGQIRNSNASMLILQLKRLGINARYLGIAGDNFKDTEKIVREGLADSDILILSGGVSVGDYDFVAGVLKKCGVKILFNKLAVKPGKPATLGVKGKKIVFGLPGNPVSAFVILELLVAPFIDCLADGAIKDKFIKYKLLSNFERKSAGKEQYYPVIFKKDGVLPVEFHGSAHLLALTRADGIMRVPADKTFVKKGSQVYVRPV